MRTDYAGIDDICVIAVTLLNGAARSTPTPSSCRCRRAIGSRWRSTRGCASGCSPTASSPPTTCTKRRPASWDDLRLVHTRGVRRRRGRRARCRARRSGASAFRGRRRWSNAPGDRWRDARGGARRARATGCGGQPRRRHASRLRRSRRGLLRLQRRRGRGPRAAARRRGPSRIAVVDCDVHQGNGTAAIFTGDADVFTFSLHGAQNFPFRKETSDLDVELEDGTGDEPYLRALAHRLDDGARRPRPELVFYLAGADPYEGDRLGRLKLTIDGLRAPRRARARRAAAPPACPSSSR